MTVQRNTDTVVLVTGATKGVRAPGSTEANSLSQFNCAQDSRVLVVKINAQSETDASDVVQALASQHGIDRLDIVIANAGIFDVAAHQKVVDMKLADLQEHIDVNAYGVIRLFQSTWPLLGKSEKPTFLLNSAGAASMGGMKTFAHFPLASYAASKMLANFFVLRLQIEHPNLIAFAVHPGSVVTENRTAAAAKLGVPVEGLSVDECVSSLLSLLDGATLATTSGTFVNVDGTPIPW
ncbi:Norsolorinic acid ketoreductase [Tolypocladium ophioglossoides CBS 100239]|uniref:Norsolorinic acid ketoreductase n=1 Tax=Tolypocladium ophioglossoides (strain CBS 100239) TaxID=1163406 RepID=A0A0L0MZF1_TOLOC|nr:Norsolorinic acid ketoreductase [Tolypocladium ophioglossoides CBS 100239]